MRDAGVSSGPAGGRLRRRQLDGRPHARWWLLRYFGHGHVAVLDGGLAAWTAAGYPVATQPVVAGHGDFVATPGGMPLIDAAGAAKLAEAGVLLDSRAPERYRGESEPVDPVARPHPGRAQPRHHANVDEQGRFLDPGAPARAFSELGIDGARKSAPTAGRACLRPTRCSRSSWRAIRRRCTRAPGASGSRIRAGPWRAVLNSAARRCGAPA